METEAEIQKHLRDLDEKKTIVTIAHRISSIKDSDLILVLGIGTGDGRFIFCDHIDYHRNEYNGTAWGFSAYF